VHRHILLLDKPQRRVSSFYYGVVLAPGVVVVDAVIHSCRLVLVHRRVYVALALRLLVCIEVDCRLGEERIIYSFLSPFLARRAIVGLVTSAHHELRGAS